MVVICPLAHHGGMTEPGRDGQQGIDAPEWSGRTVDDEASRKDEGSIGRIVIDDLDQKVLALRHQGRSFLDIALILDLDDAHSAHAAFVRALRQRHQAEKA